MENPSESQIINSWNTNAQCWNRLIEEDQLESRRLVTNQAIVDVLAQLNAQNILDIGCGEGWLVRRMHHAGIKCHGVDGSAKLISMALEKGNGTYECISYGDIISGKRINHTPYEALVFNFALFDEDSTFKLLQSLKAHLVPKGKIVIQSLHPEAMPQSEKSRWEADVWKGLPGAFTDTYPWYLRSMEDWKKLFEACNLSLMNTYEPTHPESQLPLSVIFVLSIT